MRLPRRQHRLAQVGVEARVAEGGPSCLRRSQGRELITNNPPVSRKSGEIERGDSSYLLVLERLLELGFTPTAAILDESHPPLSPGESSLLDRNDDLRPRMPLLCVSDGIGSFIERIAPVNHRSYFPGRNQFAKPGQIISIDPTQDEF